MKIYWYKGSKNIIGAKVKEARLSFSPLLTQKDLAEKCQLLGFEFDRLTVLRIENGKRFVTDYEVFALSKALNKNLDYFFESEDLRL